MGRGAPRNHLAQLIQASRRTVIETCREYERTSAAMSEQATLSDRTLSRWMAGEIIDAQPVRVRVAERHWGKSWKTLIGPPLAVPDEVAVMAPAQLAGPPVPAMEAAALLAAQESARHAAIAGGAVDPNSVDQVRSDIRRIARRYGDMAPIEVLAEVRAVRELVYVLLDRTKRPDQTRDLYLVAGQACGLMADASFDMAIWDAVESQARAAYTYADMIGHNGLRAWARGAQALLCYWTGDPRRGVDYAAEAAAWAPAGPALARMRCIEARAWSHLRALGQVRAAVGAADDALAADDGTDDLFIGVGGEFGWGPALHSACAGTALLTAGAPIEAAGRLAQALAAAEVDPYGFRVADRISVDIAGAEIGAGRLDAAVHALTHVWLVPPPLRRQAITGRLEALSTTLAEPRWRHQRDAVGLRDRIGAYASEETRQRALPSA